MDLILTLDHKLFYFINAVATHPWLDLFFPWITDLHKSIWFQGFVYPSLLLAFWWRFKKVGILLFLGLVFCVGLSDFLGNELIKQQVQRMRPGDNPEISAIVRSPYGGTSFVSNHALNCFAFANYVSFFFPAQKALLMVVASTVAYSRVYNGVHFPLDVICGGLLGALWGFIFPRLLMISLKSYRAKIAKRIKA